MNQQPPDRLLRSFERYLRATNRSERTVGNCLENLHQVEAFLRPRGLRLRDATRADLEDFLADLLSRSMTDRENIVARAAELGCDLREGASIVVVRARPQQPEEGDWRARVLTLAERGARAVERTWSTAAWMSFFQPLIENAPWLPDMPRSRGEKATKPMSSAMRSASSAMADTAPAVPAGPEGYPCTMTTAGRGGPVGTAPARWPDARLS